MEHILLAMDGTKTDISTIDFACYITRITHSKLTLLLMGRVRENEIPVQKMLFALPYVETIVASDIPNNWERIKCVEENEKCFGEACTNRNISYSIRRNLRISIPEIIKESRFSDLIIINPATCLSDKNEGSPTHLVKEILSASECPVILAPYSFEGISEIAFPYDGSEASVFAIKQFTHLFPEFNTKPISLIQVDYNKGQPIKENEKITALLRSHYNEVNFVHLVGNAGNELFNYLLGKEEMFVVMGAFGRNPTFNIFRRSTAELSLETINLPFFISHNK
jgi:hypothetical protein